MSKPRLIAFILFIALALVSASCEQDRDITEGNSSYVGLNQDEETGDEENDHNDGGISQIDKKELIFLSQRGDGYEVDYITSKGETGDIIGDAVYRRNAAFNEATGKKVSQITTKDILAEVQAKVLSGIIEFDVILARGHYLSALAKDNLLFDLNRLGVDMSTEHWDSNASRDLAILKGLYFTNCDLNISNTAHMIFFNQRLIDQFKLTSPYDFIEKNEWTLDNFGTLARSVSRDLDGDGKYDENDLLGLTFEHSDSSVLLYGAGVRATENSAVGYPVLTLSGEKTDSAYGKIKSIFSDNKSALCLSCSTMDAHGYGDKYGYIRYLFTINKGLFYISTARSAKDFKDMKNGFGIAPIPKYDSSQESYKSLWAYDEILIALPSNCQDGKAVGELLDRFAYHSNEILIPEWTKAILGGTKADGGDNDDKRGIESLKIIRNTTIYDIGLYLDFGGIRTKILEADPLRNDISINYNEFKKVIEADIADTYRAFE